VSAKTSIWLSILIGIGAGGCSDSSDKWSENRPPTVTAEGVVTYKGEGVEGATLVIIPESVNGDSVGASSMTDSGGGFALSAFPPEEGVVVGRYRVGVTKLQAVAMAPAGPDAHEQTTSAPPPQNLLPQQYADPLSSGLLIEVPEGGTTDLKIDLK
jgi:hypothetical protein